MAIPPQIREERQPGPQPERHEPPVDDPGLTDLSKRDWKAIFIRAGKEALDDGITDLAAALAYYAFLAIPAILLVTLGVFASTAGQDTVDELLDKLGGVVPPEAIQLLDESLTRTLENQGGNVLMIVVGAVLAVWTATGAMGGLMRGLNRVYDVKETRNFAKQRLTGLMILGCIVVAFALVFGLLVLGPVLSDLVGEALNLEGAMGWLWWTLQWPIILVGLSATFATILYLGPNVDLPKFRFITPGVDSRRRRVARRVGALRALRRPLRVVQQDVGLARGGHRDADMALAERPRAAPRGRGERGGRAVATAPRLRLGGLPPLGPELETGRRAQPGERDPHGVDRLPRGDEEHRVREHLGVVDLREEARAPRERDVEAILLGANPARGDLAERGDEDERLANVGVVCVQLAEAGGDRDVLAGGRRRVEDVRVVLRREPPRLRNVVGRGGKRSNGPELPAIL